MALAAQGRGRGGGAADDPVPTAQQWAASAETQKHVAAAMALAKNDLVAEAKAFCTPTGPQREALARQAAGLPPVPDRVVEPIRIFDNLYYFGFNDVGAWAIPTSAGIIVFDTLNSGDEARDVLVPGMKKMGLDPAQIKYVIIGHGHADHFGGGRYLQDTYKPRILMGAPDWDTVVRATRPAGPQMTRDMDVTDGQKITLGDTTVTLALTPGHTPGTIAMTFPARHRGQPGAPAGRSVPGGVETHMVMLLSGTQMPDQKALAVFEHVFTDFGKKMKAESAIGSHPGILMNTLPAMEKLRDQYPTGAHPFLIGPERFGRYLSIVLECGKARLAAAQSRT
jgi:metallo-beta-lactamase class B